jgi:hypothetical protein
VAQFVDLAHEAERHEPAHGRLPVHGTLAGLQRAEVQRASRAAGELVVVVEAAGVVDEGGHPTAVGLSGEGALGPSGGAAVLPLVRREPLRRSAHADPIVAIGEVGSVRAAPLAAVGRILGQDPLAPGAEDACPRTGQKRHVEEPRGAVWIIESDVLPCGRSSVGHGRRT